MSIPIVVLALVPLMVLLWFLRAPFRSSSSSWRMPPGPPGLPFVGHFHLLGRHPHRSIRKIGLKYGPLVTLRLGTTNILFATSPAMSRELLKTQDHVFASRPTTLAAKVLSYESKDLVFTPYGEHWKMLKAMSIQELLSEKNTQKFQDSSMEQVSVTVSRLKEASDLRQVVNVTEILNDFAFNILTRMIIGKTYCGPVTYNASAQEVESFQEYVKLSHEAIRLSGTFHFGEYLPWLRWFDSKLKRMAVVRQMVDGIQEPRWEGLFEERRKNPSTYFLDTMLKSLPSASAKERSYYIQPFIQSLLAAGTDAVSLIPQWALAELISHPEVMKTAQEEIQAQVHSKKLVEECDIPNLPYLQAIVKETLRLHPSVPFTIVHMSMDDCNIGSYSIPKGTPAYVNLYAVGRDPSVWSFPDEFRPQRFMEEDINIMGHNFNMTPFGSGRRGCPGSAFGLASVHLVLANLIHNFEWELPYENGKPRECFQESCSIVLAMAQPLMAFPKAR